MRRWCILVILALACALFPLGEFEVPISARLMDVAESCGFQAHAFYIEAAATVPNGQAGAVLRLANRAVREWPMGEAHAMPDGNTQRITLAATCPPEATQAQVIENRMRMLLGQSARISTCLTARTAQGEETSLDVLAEEAMLSLDDRPRQALREKNLVSLTGERAQVAMRKDDRGVMVFLACPLVPMDY